MKKTLVATFLLFAVALLGILVWYMAHTRSSTSFADQFEVESKNRRLIPVEFEVTAPPETPADQTLYLSGSEPALGNWEAAGIPLARGEDGKYRGKVEVMSGLQYAYKVTRSTWGTVEKGPKGEEIENRTLACNGPERIAIVVAQWVDGGKAIPGRMTLAGDIRVHKKFRSELLGNERKLNVYVPPGYEENADRRYPVLYVHDGQSLFNEATSYAGVEWRLDESAQQLIADGKMQPLIIVGIFNSPDRDQEFTDFGGRTDLYGKFVVTEVKPYIDRVYRTLPDRAHTVVAGAQRGGTAALRMARGHKDTFSSVAALTPQLRVNGKPLTEAWSADASWARGTRFWFDMSPSPARYYPGDDPLADARALAQYLTAAGLRPDADFKYVELNEGEHQEKSWQKQVDGILLFLFPASGSFPATSPAAGAD